MFIYINIYLRRCVFECKNKILHFYLDRDVIRDLKCFTYNVNPLLRSKRHSVLRKSSISQPVAFGVLANFVKSLHPRNQVLGCPQPKPARIRVLWEQIWVRNVVSFRRVLQNKEIMEA